MTLLRILFIGDIVGRPGRKSVKSAISRLNLEDDYDLVIANGENAAGGFGLTGEVVEEIFDAGVDVVTTGNHVWDKKEGIPHVENSERILRPLNYPPGCPGKGYGVYAGKSGHEYLVINLSGRVFMGNYDCPFRAVGGLLDEFKGAPLFKVVDIHAEATSEKEAMGWYLNGRVSAVVGTHTHVQTADNRILDGGTGYITDAGMCGPMNGVIGMRKEEILTRFLNQMPTRFEVASGPQKFCGVVITVDEDTGRCEEIRRIYQIND